MNVEILEERGYDHALLGLSLSYRQDVKRMRAVAERLAPLGDGHNKYLETMVVWLDIDAPRYFWQQFDTYRVGVSKQSESTMHTMTSRSLQQDDFEHPIPEAYLNHLNRGIAGKEWESVKHDLPESFLQRRIVCLNYMVLQRIVRQRRSHKLTEWQQFIRDVLVQLEHPELLREEGAER